jgi:hypothetical protein
VRGIEWHRAALLEGALPCGRPRGSAAEIVANGNHHLVFGQSEPKTTEIAACWPRSKRLRLEQSGVLQDLPPEVFQAWSFGPSIMRASMCGAAKACEIGRKRKTAAIFMVRHRAETVLEAGFITG